MDPINEHGNGAEGPRCAVVLKNGKACDKRIVGDRCEGNHFQKGNEARGIGKVRLLDQEWDRQIRSDCDAFLREAGYSTVERPGREAKRFFTMLASLYLLIDRATRKGRIAEASQLLSRLTPLLGMRSQFHAPVSHADRLAGEAQAKSNEELIAFYEGKLHEFRTLLSMRDALPNNASSAALHRLQTESNPPTRNNGVAPDHVSSSPEPPTSTVAAAAGLTFSEPPGLDPSPESVASSRPASAVPSAVSRPPVSSEPTIPTRTRYGREFGEREVRQVMADAGDLPEYEMGRISKHEAYRRTRAFLEQLTELPRGQR